MYFGKPVKILSVLLSLVLILSAVPAGFVCAFASDSEAAVYVSPVGNNSGSGNADAPFADIGTALARAKEKNASVIYFYPGTYSISSTLHLGRAESGISFKAVDGADVSFSGGLSIGGCWDGVSSSGDITYWYKNFSAEQMSDIGQVTSFYSETEALTNARMPDIGYYYAEGGGRPQGTDPTFLRNLSLYGKVRDIGLLSNEDDLGSAFIRIYHYWVEEIAHIVSVNRVTGEVLLSNVSVNTINNGDAYCIENVRAGFNAPGEWYMDYSENKLCYIPRQGDSFESTPFYVGYTEKMIEINGADNITFEGIKFENSGWNYEVMSTQAAYREHAAITVYNSENIDFTDCTFEKIGAGALNFGNYGSAVSDCTVSGCSFNHIGAQAVVISGTGTVSNTAARAENVTVTDNLISNYGEKRKMAVGILAPYCNNCTITHNEIHDATYSAVSCGWSWGYAATTTDHNNISYNLIYNIGNGPLSDMGGIYTLGLQEGTVIRNNVIFNVRTGKDATTYGGWGIYLDEGSSDIEVKNNVVYGCGSQGFHQHYGQNNLLINNIFAYNEEGQVRSSRNEVSSGRNNQFTLTHNILAGSDRLMYHHIDYGQFTDSNNLYYDASKPAGTVFSGENPDADCGSNYTTAQMTAKGYYNNAVFADPCFVDPENGNFSLYSAENASSAGFDGSEIIYSEVGSESFGSRYLINDLAGAKSCYPAGLWSAWENAKAAAVENRTEENISTLASVYNALKERNADDNCFADRSYYFNENDPLCSAFFSAEEAVVRQAETGPVSASAENSLSSAYNAMKNAEYTVTMNYNGGNSMTGNIKYRFESVISLPEPVRPGYRFDGYLRSSDNCIITDVQSYRAGAGSYTLTAVWTKAHTIMLDEYNLFDLDSYTFGSNSAGVASASKNAEAGTVSFVTSGESNIFVNGTREDRFELNPSHLYRIHFNCTVKNSDGVVQNNWYRNSRLTLMTYYNNSENGHNAGDWAGEYHDSTYESLKNGTVFTVHNDASVVTLRFGAGDTYKGTAQAPYTVTYSDIYLEDLSDNVNSYIQKADGETVGSLPEYDTGGYFAGWNTEKDGSGVAVDKNTHMSSSFDDYINLYAQNAEAIKVYFDNEFNFNSVGYGTSAGGNNVKSYTVDENNKTYTVTSKGNDCYVNTGSDVHMSLEGGHTYAVYYDVEVKDASGNAVTGNPYSCSRITVLPYTSQTGGNLVWQNNPMCVDILKCAGEFTVNPSTPYAQLRFGVNNAFTGYTVKYSNIAVIDVTGKSSSAVADPWYGIYGGNTELNTLPDLICRGKVLTGWNTEKDGSGDTYSVGDVLPGTDLYLFSCWEECRTVRFDSVLDFDNITWNTDGHNTANTVVDGVSESIKFDVTGDDAYLVPSGRFVLTAGHTYKFFYRLRQDGIESLSHSRFTLMAYDSNGTWSSTHYRENLNPGTVYTVTQGYETFSIRLGMGGSSAGHTLEYSEIYVQDVTNSTGSGDNLSFPVLDGERLLKKTVGVGKTIGTLPSESREGYTFTGWNTKADGTGITYTGTEIMGSSDIRLYSQWVESIVSVRFNVNYDNIPVNILTLSTDEITKSGLSYSYNRTTGIITLNGTPSAGSTLFSVKIPGLSEGTYTVSAEYVGGSVNYIDGKYNSAPYFEWTDNTTAFSGDARKFFDIRFEKSNLSPLNLISKQITVGPDECVNQLYFNYYNASVGKKSFDNYQFRIKMSGSQSASLYTPCSVNVPYGEEYGTLPEITRDGYKFLGWYTSSAGGTKVTESSFCNGSEKVTLFAHWKTESHKTFFDVNYGDNAGKPNRAVIAGLRDGVFEAVSSGTVSGISYSYDAADGVVTLNGTLSKSSSSYFYIPVKLNDVSERYKVRIKRVSGENTINYSDTVKNVTLTADFCNENGTNISTRKYVSAFFVNNKISMSESGGMLPSLTAALASEVKGIRLWSYLNFDENATGWVTFTDYKFRIELISEASNTSFRDNLPAPLFTLHNNRVERLPVPVRDGYTFAGWYTDSSLSVPFDSSIPVTSDSTLYAKWYYYEAIGGAQTDSVFDSELLYGVCIRLTEGRLTDYLTWDESVSVSCEASGRTDIIGTGSVIKLKDSSTQVVFKELTVVLFGDVNGDGVYDAQDAVIVSCIANGLITREQAGDAVYVAADCNHDGTVDALDVTVLEQAGVLLEQINQLGEDELAASSVYEQYINLIDQCSVSEPGFSSDEPVGEASRTLLSMLYEIIIKIINFIKNYFAVLTLR